MKLDSLDLKIMRMLQKDARVSFSAMAKELHTAEATVRFRIKRLVSNGVIVKHTTIFNPGQLGISVSGAILLKAEPNLMENVATKIASLQEASYVFQSTGEYDFVAVVFARNMDHMNDLLKRIKSLKGVRDAKLSVTTRFVKFDPSVPIPE